jgi:hypothetical protein
MDNVLESTGIDSSREGLDVSPINDMKQTWRCDWQIKWTWTDTGFEARYLGWMTLEADTSLEH